MRVSRLQTLHLVLALVAAAPLARAAATAPPARAKTVADTPKGVLPFIEDDYGKALSLARQKKVPIFVEAWAPW